MAKALLALALAVMVFTGNRLGAHAATAPAARHVQTAADDTKPDPNTLLNQAAQALRKAGTFHFVADSKLQLNALADINLHDVGDVDLKQQTARGHDTGTEDLLGTSQNVNERRIQIKTKYWHKSKATKSKWAKGQVTAGATFDFKHFTFRLDTPSSGLTSSDLTPTTVSLEQLNGASVWHVHGDFTVKSGPSNTPVPGTVDYYITQQGALPVPAKLYFNDTADSILLDIREALSNFGEPLSVKAPKVGSTKPAGYRAGTSSSV